VKIDLKGNIVWKPNTDYGINVSGHVIHGAIHQARAQSLNSNCARLFPPFTLNGFDQFR
jgi:ribulose-5-phosphate 4-epimerase/fuculose-1-phosphate aldolase